MIRGRLRPHAVVLAATALLAMTALGPPATNARTEPVARMAGSCAVPRYPGSGYFTSLTVKGVSCTTGRKLVRAYYRCRTRTGKAGRCHSRVLKFRCTERRNSIPTEIDARVSCRRGAKRVTHTYQQNT
jgi:hypothetical protein